MHEISDEKYGEICGIISGISGLMQQMLLETLTDRQKKYVDRALKALLKMRTLLNGDLDKKRRDIGESSP